VEDVLELQEDPVANKRRRDRAERREMEMARIQAAGTAVPVGKRASLGKFVVPGLPGLHLGQPGSAAPGPGGSSSGMMTHRTMELSRLDSEFQQVATAQNQLKEAFHRAAAGNLPGK